MRHSYALLPALWAWILCACCLAPASPEALLAVGFRTPEQTFRTFQTGLRSDLPGLEYRSFSEGFRRRNDVTELNYRLFREELFREDPWLKLAAKAEIVESIELGGPGGRRRIVARVKSLFFERTFAVDLVREDFYETRDAEGLLEDDYVAWTDVARVEGDALVLTVPMPQGVGLDEIVELRAGQEWKIDDFELLGDT